METTPEQTAEGAALVKVLAAVLERLVGANVSLAVADPGQVTKFHALKAPGIGIEQYLERIHKYASCSNECYVLALIYVDRLIQRNNFLLTELNVHRVVITAILLAAKFFDDAYYNNAYYAKVGGVLISEMNGLEVDFLFRINFSLHVTPELFQKYRAELVSHAVGAGVTMPPSAAMHTVRPMHHVDTTTTVHAQPQLIQQTNQFPNFASASSAKQPTYITPSPTAPSQPILYPSDSGGSGSDESMHQASSVPATKMTSGLAEVMLASGHSYPLPQRCSPRFNGTGMVPVFGTMGGIDAGGQYVVIDNVAFPIQGGMIHVNHNEAPVKGEHNGGGYHAKSEPTAAVTVTPHFVG